MNTHCRRVRNKRRGILTFEWILLITVLVIGIVGGVSAVRDALLTEMGDVCGALVAIDQSYTVTATGSASLGNAFQFTDSLPSCTGNPSTRPTSSPKDQGAIGPCGSGG